MAEPRPIVLLSKNRTIGREVSSPGKPPESIIPSSTDLLEPAIVVAPRPSGYKQHAEASSGLLQLLD